MLPFGAGRIWSRHGFPRGSCVPFGGCHAHISLCPHHLARHSSRSRARRRASGSRHHHRPSQSDAAGRRARRRVGGGLPARAVAHHVSVAERRALCRRPNTRDRLRRRGPAVDVSTMLPPRSTRHRNRDWPAVHRRHGSPSMPDHACRPRPPTRRRNPCHEPSENCVRSVQTPPTYRPRKCHRTGAPTVAVRRADALRGRKPPVSTRPGGLGELRRSAVVEADVASVRRLTPRDRTSARARCRRDTPRTTGLVGAL